MKKTITLYTLSWNGYWDKHSKKWINYINNLNTKPDEIIIVSDNPIDTSKINHPNINNIVLPINNYRDVVSLYRNTAAQNSSCDWVVASDIDDMPLPNYLDGLDIDADICGFSFMEQANKKIYKPDETSLEKRLLGIVDGSLIPGTSAIKRSVFNKIRYERFTYEDLTFWFIASKLNLTVANPTPDDIRFIYAGYHIKPNRDEITRVSEIYKKVLKNDRNLYCFWFSGKMSENRKKSLDILRQQSKVNVVLIDLPTFYKYEHKEFSIHKGFKYLSDVHKSAYARAYMMYFYGEGYTDIKANSFDWNPYFDQLFTSNFDAIGYPEKKWNDIAPFWQGNVPNYVVINANKFAGNGHYIFKPKTKFAYDWLVGIHKILDEKYEVLKNNDGSYSPYAIPGGVHNKNQDKTVYSQVNYPISWNEINGRVRQKIEYENNFSNFILNMPYVNTKNYR